AAAVVERSVEGLPEAALVVQVPEPLQALRRLAEALRDAHPIPAVGITGNVGKTTTKEATAAALGARYRVLRSAASFNNEIGLALLNADDPRVRSLAPGTKARVVLYGESSDAELRATDVRATGLDGLRFVARRGAETADVRLPIPGRHLVTAALAAIGAATEL